MAVAARQRPLGVSALPAATGLVVFDPRPDPVTRLREVLGPVGPLDLEDAVAYADSASDIPVLFAGSPVILFV